MAFFWTLFRQINSTRVGGFRVFFGSWPEFFQDFTRVFRGFFYQKYPEFFWQLYLFNRIFMSKKYIMVYWKKLLIRCKLFRFTFWAKSFENHFFWLWSPFRQLNSSGVGRFWVFWKFGPSFFRIWLEFWVFLSLSFFQNVQK